MTEITIQDVATYLAEHGYVRWEELTARKMMTEEAMWTRLQSNYDPTRAIDSRYISFPSLSAYATQQWVSALGYATQEWVLSRGFITQSPNLSSYVTNSALNAMGLASQSWVSQNYATQAALGNYLPLAGGIITGSLTVNGAIIGANYVLATTLSDSWSDGTYNHPWYGIDHRYTNRGVYSTTISDYYGMLLRTAQSTIALTQGGNIGINNYSPSCALDVVGTVKATSICVGSCTISYDNGMLHFSTGIYSDGAVTAGGVGTSGGSGGGGLSWANLAASTTEQIALSHLTTALSGYLPLTGGTVSHSIICEGTFSGRNFGDWGETVYFFGNDAYLSGDYSVMMHLNNDSLSIYMEDGDDSIYMSGKVSVDNTITAAGRVTAKNFKSTDYDNSNYLLTGNGSAVWLPYIFSYLGVSGNTLSITIGDTNKQVTLPSGGLTSYGYRPIIGASGATTTWIDENYGVILPLTGIGGGNYGLDLSGVFTELTVSGTTLYATVGGTRKSVTLPGGMSALTSRHYASRSAFLQTFTHVTDEYSVIQCVTVMATSGNDYLLAITLSDSEGQHFVIRAVSGNKVLWQATTPNEQAITAIVWMNPSNYYTIEI